MTTSYHRETAKIYEFPIRGRAGLASRRDDARPTAELAALRVSDAAFGGSWYHEAAVQEDRGHKR